MRKMYSAKLLHVLAILLFTVFSASAQINFTESWDSGLGSWTFDGSDLEQTDVLPCTSTGSVRTNLYEDFFGIFGSESNTLKSPLLGVSNGGTVTLTYEYKLLDYTSSGVPTNATPNPWGNIKVEYAYAETGPWTTVQTINQTNHNPSTSCVTKTVTFNPLPGDLYIRFRSSWTDGDYYIYYDEVSVTQGPAPSCIGPAGLNVTSLTAATAGIEWQSSISTASGYQWEIRSAGVPGSGATGLGASGSTAAAVNTATATGLSANTNYSLYVRTVCGSSDNSAWSGPFDFTTPCLATNVPYTIDFENVTTPAIPECTQKENLGNGNEWITSNPGGNGFNSNALTYNYDDTEDADAWFYTRAINLTAGVSYRISYLYGNNSSFYTEKMEVKYGVGADAASMNDLLADYPAITGGAAQTGVVDFTPTVTGVYYIGFHAYSDADQFNLYVDDISVTLTPTCDAPSGLAVSNPTTTGVQLDWNAPTVGGTPASYSVYYSTTNTAPALTAAPSVKGLSGTTNTIGGLAPGTTYYFWVRSVCSASDSSAWTGPVTITTLCVPVTTLPWTENFDALTTVGPNSYPACWLKENGDWETTDEPNGGNYPGPRSGANYLIDAWSATDEFIWTPGIQLTAGQSYDFSFYFAGDEYDDWTGDVFVNSTQNSTGATQLGGSFVTQGTVVSKNYTLVRRTFQAAATGEYFFAIRVNATSSPWYIAFDDFKVEVTPSCTDPTDLVISNIATNGAQLDWTAPTTSTPASYSIYVGTSSVDPAATAAPTVAGITGTTYTIGNLNAATTYYVWVRSKCSATDSSSWAGPVSFTTLCVPVATLPWTENFDGLASVGETKFPPCWLKENGDWQTSNEPAGGNYAGPRSGANYLLNKWSATDEFIWTPAFQLTAGTSYDFSFFFAGDANDGWTGDVFVNSAATGSGATQLGTSFVTSSVTTSTSYAAVKRSFEPTTTGEYYFAIRVNATSNPWYLSFDDFKVEVSPSCVEPTDLIASNATANGGQIDWTAPTNAPASYSIYVTTSAAVPAATQAPTVANISGTSYVLGGLNIGTSYYVWVRSKCSGTDSSAWAGPVMLYTVPANDDCGSAVTLVKGTGEQGTTWGASESQTPSTCSSATSASAMDVWYTFTADYNGSATITLSAVTGYDIVLEVLSGSCGSFTTLGCKDDYGAGTGETVTVSGLTAGTQYYARVYGYTTATNTTQGKFTITATGSALPVTFVSFTGERRGNANLLSWTTATEANNKGFELQRSADGNSYTTIAAIATKAENGYSAQSVNYQYTDEKITASASYYYRVKQIDNDGKFSYSNAVLIEGNKTNKLELVSVYPNPAKDALSIKVATPKADNVTLIITDMTGKVVLQQRANVIAGDNQLQLNVHGLSQGSYLLKAICADGCETAVRKFVKE